jgi:hypothetical protein
MISSEKVPIRGTSNQDQAPDRQVDEPAGRALIAAMRASPYRDIEIEPQRGHLPVRNVAL